jgi:hypothetical protein
MASPKIILPEKGKQNILITSALPYVKYVQIPMLICYLFLNSSGDELSQEHLIVIPFTAPKTTPKL